MIQGICYLSVKEFKLPEPVLTLTLENSKFPFEITTIFISNIQYIA